MEGKYICRDWMGGNEKTGIWYGLYVGRLHIGDSIDGECYVVACHYDNEGTENHYVYTDYSKAKALYDIYVG